MLVFETLTLYVVAKMLVNAMLLSSCRREFVKTFLLYTMFCISLRSVSILFGSNYIIGIYVISIDLSSLANMLTSLIRMLQDSQCYNTVLYSRDNFCMASIVPTHVK